MAKKTEKVEAKSTNQVIEEVQTTPPPMPQLNTKTERNLTKIFLIILGVLLFICCICSVAGWLILEKTRGEVQESMDSLYGTSDWRQNNPEPRISPSEEDNSEFSVKLPSDFPKDAPIYANASLKGVSESGKSEEQISYIANFLVTDTHKNVVDFYKQKLPENGWTLDKETNIFGTVLDAKKSERTINIFIFELKGETTITMTVRK